jgi:superfamily II DNA or RNA helicase
MGISLMKHNVKTYENLVNKLKTSESIAVVQATGTGKSYIALKYIEESCSGTVVVVVPSNVLADYWIKQSKKLKDVEINVLTYALLSKCTDEQLSEIADSCNLLILDEMHRAGAEKWGLATKNIMSRLLSRNVKTIGLTATPIRSLDNNKDVVKELFEGLQVTGIDLKDAIIQGVLPTFKYISALYNIEQEIRNAKERVDESKYLNKKEKRLYSRVLNSLLINDKTSTNIKEILNKHLDMNVCQKIIVFARDIQDKDNLQQFLEDWFPTATIYDLDSRMTREECSISIDNFNNAKTGINIMKSVNKLNEGVHVKGVTGLIMLRKTQSNIIFFQQLGRALDASNKDKDIVVFDLVNNYQEVRTKNSIIDFIGFINNNKRPDGKSIIINDYTKDILDVLNEINMRIDDSWSKEEDDVLIKYYPIEYEDVYKRLTGRTREACRHRAVRLGIHINRLNEWTNEEDEILKKYYPEEGMSVYKRFKDRSKTACSQRAKLLGIKKKQLTHKDYIWTDKELEILKEHYPKEGKAVNVRLKNKPKNVCAIKAKELGLIYEGMWSDKELDILKEWYPKEGTKVCRRLEGRSETSCGYQARNLGLTPPSKTRKIKAVDEKGNSIVFNNTEEASMYLINHNLTTATKWKSVRTGINTVINKDKLRYGFYWKHVE